MAHLLLGALLSSSISAQSEEDLGRLIFESSYFPLQAAAGAGGAAAGGAAAGGSDAMPAGNGATPGSDAAVPDAADSSTNPEADIAAYKARILDTQAAENPYSNSLREQYDALGTVLQQTGAHTDAIDAFASAMHIDRVNGGLFTLDQIPLVEKLIASQTTLGNFEEVNDLHGYLFYIQQKSFAEDDPRLQVAKEEWADWNVEAYMKEGMKLPGSSMSINGSQSNSTDYVAIQNRDGSFNYVPRNQLLNVLNPNGAATTDLVLRSSTYAVSAEQVIDERLRTARTIYEEILGAEDPATDADMNTDEFRVAHKLANTAYAVKMQMEAMDTVVEEGSLHYNRILRPRVAPQVVTRGYIRSREALEEIAQGLEQNPDASVLQKAQAWIYLGDWHVGFDAAQRGQDAYRKAWELMSSAGMEEPAITAVFLPQPLIPAPAFAIHKYSRALYGIDPDAQLVYRGYMDLTLSVNRYGDVRGIKIDTANPEVSQVLRSALVDFLREQKMRPALANGETVAREELKLRYYYSF